MDLDRQLPLTPAGRMRRRLLLATALAAGGLAAGRAAGLATRFAASGAADPATQAAGGLGSEPVALAGAGPITAVWANDGGDKVAREELRARTGQRRVLNRSWDGSRVRLFGARNEVIGFALVLEAADAAAIDVAVVFDGLTGPGGRRIASRPAASPDGVFDWTTRPIELFLVRYLPIRGLSALSYDTYDERHVPERLQRPMDADGNGRGGWSDRGDHDLSYPDIAVPMELHPAFSIEAGTSQMVWIDIAVPRDAPPGGYAGTVAVTVAGVEAALVPVELDVRDFTLPDRPTSRTMVATSYGGVAARYTGVAHPEPDSSEDRLTRTVLTRQLMLAHRHRIALIDDNGGAAGWTADAPRPDWIPALTGALFTAGNGYAGPGEGVGNGVFSVATYGIWRDWWGGLPSPDTMRRHAAAWEAWFRAHAPDTERFLYLIDESEDYAQTERWAAALKADPAAPALPSFATADLVAAGDRTPSLDVTASWIAVGDTTAWEAAVRRLRADPRKRLMFYNGRRPASGSFAIEDDGVALRELPWGQWKLGVDRWFFWEATYYDDFQGGRGPTDVFSDAQTFGGAPERDPEKGLAGWNSSNGDGVLFYPGTDRVFPAQSYDLAGPIASLRLKLWRRGIQDVDYLALAHTVDPAATRAIMDRMVPKALWEVGVADPSDPTWMRGPISWSTDPDVWEAARAELADIIERRR